MTTFISTAELTGSDSSAAFDTADLPAPTPVDARAMELFALRLREVDRPATAAECVARISALEAIKAAACAAQAAAEVRFGEIRVAERAADGVAANRRETGIANEIAMARKESPHTAARLLNLGRLLETDLHGIGELLRLGIINEYRAQVIAREAAVLSASDRQRFDEEICADRDRLAGLGTRSMAKLAKRTAYAIDPSAVVDRLDADVKKRYVSSAPGSATMVRLRAMLPMAQGVAVIAALQRVAVTKIATGDSRSKAQIMADTLVERVTGQETATAVPVSVNLTMPATVLAGSEEPAEVRGFGPIPAELARRLLASALQTATAEYRRLFLKPDTGGLVNMDSKRRRFSGGLARFLIARDGTCATPYCGAPIRHLDHITPVAEGGATTAANGQGLCEQCNYAKESVDISVRTYTDRKGRRIVETTTSTGEVYRRLSD